MSGCNDLDLYSNDIYFICIAPEKKKPPPPPPPPPPKEEKKEEKEEKEKDVEKQPKPETEEEHYCDMLCCKFKKRPLKKILNKFKIPETIDGYTGTLIFTGNKIELLLKVNIIKMLFACAKLNKIEKTSSRH